MLKNISVSEHVEQNMGYIRLCGKITAQFELMQLYHLH